MPTKAESVVLMLISVSFQNVRKLVISEKFTPKY